MQLEINQVWRGKERGSLLRVVGLDDFTVRTFVIYSGNPYWITQVGGIRTFSRLLWHDLMEYAPEWND